MSNPKIDIWGNKVWFSSKKLFHRLDGPAIEGADGSKEWWVEGKRHRLDGPAVERSYKHREWYVDDEEVTEEEYPEAVLLYKCRMVLES